MTALTPEERAIVDLMSKLQLDDAATGLDVHTLLKIIKRLTAASPEGETERTPLFTLADFTSHSGQALSWKIDCDALTNADWETLAKVAAERLEPFCRVVGVPSGGLKFADALRKYVTSGAQIDLIADDVLTTGASMEDQRKGMDYYQGVVAFARGPCPEWVMPLFMLHTPAQIPEEIAEIEKRHNEDEARRIAAWGPEAKPIQEHHDRATLLRAMAEKDEQIAALLARIELAKKDLA